VHWTWNRLVVHLEHWLLNIAGPGGALTAGYQNLKKGRYETAAEAFADAELLLRKRNEPDSKIAEAVALRAWCYVKLGRASEAVPLYEQAIALEGAVAAPERIDQLREQLAWARSETGS